MQYVDKMFNKNKQISDLLYVLLQVYADRHLSTHSNIEERLLK